MKDFVGTAVVAALIAGSSFAAQAQVKTESVPMPAGTRGVAEVVTVTATVQAIDQKTRQVTLKGPEGKVVSFKAGDEVKNLAQVKVGDQVVVKYFESIAFKLQKPGSTKPEASLDEGIVAAKPGEKPAGAAARKIRVTTTIQAIDAIASYVTLVGPEGNAWDVKVKDPKVFTEVKIGDKVDVTYTEALAIAVEPAPKAEPKAAAPKADPKAAPKTAPK